MTGLPWFYVKRPQTPTNKKSFFQSETPIKEHWWRYSILMENVGDIKVQLRERTWCIFSNADNKESVTGKGVVGQVRDVSSSSSIILILGRG